MKQAEILVLLFLVAVFVAPSTSSQVLAADLEMMTIAVAETDEEYDDYQDDREEAAGDIYSHSEDQEDAETEDVEDEVEEPDLDLDEDEPDL
jgi:hypothetical protein